MLFKVEYHKNSFVVLDRVMETIPALKGGKSDGGAIVSFVQDIETYRRFRGKYFRAQDKTEQKELIDKWNDFIFKRENENYIPQRQSQHADFYYTLF